ncbi:class I SAM-dependent methyltransferase [Algoriphagus lacus]|uniref:Class I SAM-dependent methyltransferase n=2 Tax=Algoriphagus lacus TaxID=2056311 RepID=A0A418PM21_9BACT|nr:class I SAM-dependent methyltransferase [Algoriphagus lacus]
MKNGSHWCRVIMDQESKKMIQKLPFDQLKTLEISGSKWRDFGFSFYKFLDFPEFDLCEDKIPDKYDLIIAEQVFEHLNYPYRAGRNVYEALNPGGYFLITVPFLLKIHNHPIDCTRWSKTGLKHFLVECGFEIDLIESDSWGNKEAVIKNLDRWVVYDKQRHSLKNEENFPLVVWALAKREIDQ